VSRIELVKEVLRAFDGPSDELGVKHNIKGVDAEVMFGFLPATVNFNHIAEALERVKGETDGKDKFQQRK
jgi:hypothetical protein